MAKEDRLISLQIKHKHLHSLVEAAEAEKAPDIYVSRMKREKLMIKDEITQLQKKVVDQFR
jgi:hypothetical protein